MEFPAPSVSLPVAVTPPYRPQLQYAPPAPWRHRRHTRHWLLAAAAMLIVLSAFIWGPAIRERMQLLYIQHECMTYTAPPSQIVFTNDPVEMPKLLASGPNCRKVFWNGALGGVARSVTEWEAFCPALKGYTSGTILCHRLKSPLGNDRIVGVDVSETSLADVGGGQSIFTVSCVFAPGSPLKPPTERVSGSAVGFSPDIRSGTIIFFAGQLDPADASHFTFVYRHRDKDTIIDGWLNDDDSVSIQERRPGSPLTRPPPGSSR